MPLLSVEGVYRNGRVELAESPTGLDEPARVIVIFLPVATPEPEPEESREALRRRAFEQMETGLHLGGPPYPKREELYDRFERSNEGAG